MNSGKKFEANWSASVPPYIFYHRIKDNASSFGQDSSFTKFTPANPYDCFIFYKGFLFPMELKTSKDKRFSFQREKGEKGRDIKLHQIKSLTEANAFDGIISGFVFDCIEHGTYWLNIKDFNRFFEESPKVSINVADIIKYGGILIEKKMKKVNYKYEVEGLLNELIKGESKSG